MLVSGPSVVGISAVALSLVLSPGPNMVYLVTRSVTQGRAAGLVSLGGVATGFFVYLALAVAGLSALFVAVPDAYVALKLAGAGYLIFLAWKTLKPGGNSAFAPGALPLDNRRKLVTMGLVTNPLNPKFAVLYVGLLPQFVDPKRGLVPPMQSTILGGIQISIALTINCLIVLSAGALSAFLIGRPRWLRRQRQFMGVVLAGLAMVLATTPTAAPR